MKIKSADSTTNHVTIDPVSKAMRVQLVDPEGTEFQVDHSKFLGSYMCGIPVTTMSATCFVFVNTTTSTLYTVRRFWMNYTFAGTAVGSGGFEYILGFRLLRMYSSAWTNGTVLTPSRKKTSFPVSAADIRIEGSPTLSGPEQVSTIAKPEMTYTTSLNMDRVPGTGELMGFFKCNGITGNWTPARRHVIDRIGTGRAIEVGPGQGLYLTTTNNDSMPMMSSHIAGETLTGFIEWDEATL